MGIRDERGGDRETTHAEWKRERAQPLDAISSSMTWPSYTTVRENTNAEQAQERPSKKTHRELRNNQQIYLYAYRLCGTGAVGSAYTALTHSRTVAWCWCYYTRAWIYVSYRFFFCHFKRFQWFSSQRWCCSTLWLEDFDIEKSDDFTFFRLFLIFPSHIDQLGSALFCHCIRCQWKMVCAYYYGLRRSLFFCLIYHKTWWCRLWWVFPFKLHVSFDSTRYVMQNANFDRFFL